MATASALSTDYLAAVLAGDSTRARHLVDAALADGLSVEAIYLDALAPALAEIGSLWERGRLGVGYEHFATAVTAGVLGALAPRIRRAPRGGRLAVLACVPGEQHTLGLQMTGDLLEAEAWEILSLGGSLPASDLASLVADERPDVVALSMATAALLPGAGEVIAALRALRPRPFILVGGRAWADILPADIAALGVDACTPDVREAVALLTARFPPLLDED